MGRSWTGGSDLPEMLGAPVELTIRTAHGAADVAVTAHAADVSLHDVLTTTTGQAAPAAALVDGRLVDTRSSLAAVALLNGSIVDTHLDRDDVRNAVTTLLQMTGPGAGAARPLPPGHYRIGPSTRRSAPELDFDTVEAAAFEIDVHPSGARISPTGPPAGLTVDGTAVTEARSWTGGRLVIDGRSFVLEPSRAEQAAEHRVQAIRDGRVVHNRPPGEPPHHQRYLLDSMLDARSQRHGLWHQRGSADAMPIDVGLLDAGASQVDDLTVATIDLVGDGVIAVTGELHDGEAVLRTLLIDAATRYGPADLGITVATDRSRLEAWDWAKWLPHARRGEVPELLANDLEIASWATAIATDVSRRMIVVVSDVDLWNQSGAPLRQLLTDRPDHVTVIALCPDRSTAPTSAAAIVELDEASPGRARLIRVDRDARIDLRVGLVDIDIAADVARHLAPLIDPDLPGASATSPAPSIPTLAGITRAEEAATRWDTQLGAPGNEIELGIGSHDGKVVSVDLGIDRGVAISGSSIDESDAIAEVIALSMATTWSPDELSIVEVDHRSAAQHDAARQLPHFAGTFADRGPDAAERFVARLRQAVNDERLAGKRLAIFVRGLDETELASSGLARSLVELASDTFGVHLVVTTATPLAAIDEAIRHACAIEIAVDHYGGARRATVHDRDRQHRTPFTPDDPAVAVNESVTVEPFLFGRPPTSLERRLSRATTGGSPTSATATQRLVDDLVQLAQDRELNPQTALVPVPLPRTLDADRFLARHRGDGIPIGLVETAGSTAPVPHWWQPGSGGSILAIGAPRAGIRGVLDVMACSVLDRFAPDDLVLSVVEHQAGRRTALAALAHTHDAVSPEQPADVRSLVAQLRDELERRRDDSTFRVDDRHAHLLLVRDLGRLPADVIPLLADIAERGADVGINVVATAARPTEAGRLTTAATTLIVGSLSDPNDYETIGVERPERFESIPGRCHASVDGVVGVIQLAEFATSLDTALEVRSAQ